MRGYQALSKLRVCIQGHVLNGNNASVETDQIDIFMQFGAGELPFRVLLSFISTAFRLCFVPLSGGNNRAGTQHLVFSASGRKWQKACLIYLHGFPHVIWLIMWLIKDTENPLTQGLYNDGSFIFNTMECLSHSTPCQRHFPPSFVWLLRRVACPPLPSFHTGICSCSTPLQLDKGARQLSSVVLFYLKPMNWLVAVWRAG